MAKVLGDKDVNAMRAEHVPSGPAKEKRVAKDLKEAKDAKDARDGDTETDTMATVMMKTAILDAGEEDAGEDARDAGDEEESVKDDKKIIIKDAKDAKDVKSMEYHRQIFRSKMAEEQSRSYISPSDTIMSPASAKISALRNKSALKAKPRSLFAQASDKKLGGESPLGATPLGARPAQQQ